MSRICRFETNALTLNGYSKERAAAANRGLIAALATDAARHTLTPLPCCAKRTE